MNTKSGVDRTAYKKQRNYVVSLMRKEKESFYSTLDASAVTENKKFWKTVKPFLSDKVKKHSKITLAEGEEIISQDDQVAKTSNEYFINIPIQNMPNQPYECNKSQEQDPVLNIIEKCKFHPSIKLIQSKNKGLSSSFSFKFATINEVKKSINNLDPKKASQKEDICTSILKANADFFASYVCNDINASISSSTFPNQLKEADIIPAHKKKSKLSGFY